MFDRTWTYALEANTGPAVFAVDLNLPDGNPQLELSGWHGAAPHTAPTWNINEIWTHSRALILPGGLALSDAQAMVAGGGLTEMLLAIPPAGIASVRLPDDARRVTLFFPDVNTIGFLQIVQFRVRQIA